MKLKKIVARLVIIVGMVSLLGGCKMNNNSEINIKEEQERMALFLKNNYESIKKVEFTSFSQNKSTLTWTANATSPLKDRIDDLEQQLETIRQDIMDLVDRNARKAQNQELYQKQYDTLLIAYQEKQKELHETNSTLGDQKSKSIRFDRFIQQLKEQDDLITDFNQELWQTSVERLDIKEGKTISLTFKNGVQIDL